MTSASDEDPILTDMLQSIERIENGRHGDESEVIELVLESTLL